MRRRQGSGHRGVELRPVVLGGLGLHDSGQRERLLRPPVLRLRADREDRAESVRVRRRHAADGAVRVASDQLPSDRTRPVRSLLPERRVPGGRRVLRSRRRLTPPLDHRDGGRESEEGPPPEVSKPGEQERPHWRRAITSATVGLPRTVPVRFSLVPGTLAAAYPFVVIGSHGIVRVNGPRWRIWVGITRGTDHSEAGNAADVYW